MIQPEAGAEESFTEPALLEVTRGAVRRVKINYLLIILIPGIKITSQEGYLNIWKPFKYLPGFHNFYIGHSSPSLRSSPSQIPKAQLPPYHL